MIRKDVTKLTESEIERLIFKGASVGEPRGFGSVFTPKQIAAIQESNENRDFFTTRFKDWLWSAYEEHCLKQNLEGRTDKRKRTR